MRSSIPRLLGAMAAAVLGAGQAQAALHLYHIQEVFTDPTGLCQIIQLQGEANNQGQFQGNFLCAGDPAITPGDPGRQCFRFDMSLQSGQTNGKSLLFVTPGCMGLKGTENLPTPDFILQGPAIAPQTEDAFFKRAGDTIDFLPSDTRTVAIKFDAFPADGQMAVLGPISTRANSPAPTTPPAVGPNLFTNFAGQMGSVDLRAMAPAPTDFDGDSVVADDNCPVTPNRDQADADGDFVGDACDSCLFIPNPRMAPSPGQTITGGQIDDDADGFGNECDAKFTLGTVVDSSDAALFMSALGKQVTDNTCGLSGKESCRAFDLFPGATVIDDKDLEAFQSLIGREIGPKGAAGGRGCSGPACVNAD